jgi:hypothetical protein
MYRRIWLLLICFVLCGATHVNAEGDFFVVSAGGSIKNKVFAMGVINTNGNVYNGKNISSINWDSTSKRCVVNFSSGNYNVYDHITLITPIGLPPENQPITVSYDQGGANAIQVGIFNSTTGQPIMKSFSIMILPPN